MASARVINYISCRRFIAVSNLKNVCILSNFNANLSFRQNALYCTNKPVIKRDPIEQKNKVQVEFVDVVKQNTESIGYICVIIGGLGITVFMCYILLNELFSSKSSNSVYNKALERCIKHSKVTDALGEPIKAYGQETRRGHRNHINYVTFMKDGVQHMRMKFYIQGIRRRGTVHVEMQEDETGKYVYRYLYVVVNDILQTIIKIEDNREPVNNTNRDSELDWR